MFSSIGGKPPLAGDEEILGASDVEGDGHGSVNSLFFDTLGFLGLVIVFLLCILLQVVVPD